MKNKNEDDALYMTSNIVAKGTCGNIKKSIHKTSRVVNFSAHRVRETEHNVLQKGTQHGQMVSAPDCEAEAFGNPGAPTANALDPKKVSDVHSCIRRWVRAG